jgi:ARG and Rhodanese-Phosphatase-superfamily-associated Protein domain
MRNTHLSHGLAVLALLLGGALALACGPVKKSDAPVVKYRLSGPYTHDNLTVYLIHGDDQVKDKNYLTLDEALGQKKVIVHETKNVNQLAVENVSDRDEVFIQAGDIVKGGQQDRVLAFDLVVPPKSGKVAINSFCVEAGRWTKRGKEEVRNFNSSKDQLATKDLKFACRQDMSQRKVWDNVAKAQAKLAENARAPVQSADSKTSLQLTLEHKKVLESIDGYVKKLTPAVADRKDVIGYAFAINGQLNSADVYASSALFKKLWPKLVKASAVEAFHELKKDRKFEPVKGDAVLAFLADPEKGKKSRKDINPRLSQVQKETERNVLFETCDKSSGQYLRRSYLAK